MESCHGLLLSGGSLRADRPVLLRHRGLGEVERCTHIRNEVHRFVHRVEFNGVIQEEKIPHSIGLSGNQRSLDWQGNLTLDSLYLSDGRLCNSSENRVNNINVLEFYHEIRGNLAFSAMQGL